MAAHGHAPPEQSDWHAGVFCLDAHLAARLVKAGTGQSRGGTRNTVMGYQRVHILVCRLRETARSTGTSEQQYIHHVYGHVSVGMGGECGTFLGDVLEMSWRSLGSGLGRRLEVLGRELVHIKIANGALLYVERTSEGLAPIIGLAWRASDWTGPLVPEGTSLEKAPRSEAI